MKTKENITNVTKEIATFLQDTFKEIDTWFDQEYTVRDYKPKNGGWTINEILEHIYLTNHFLLILIDKGTTKSLNSSKINLQEEIDNYVFQRDKLTEIGLHNSFDWFRPEHMNPKGINNLIEVKIKLNEQFKQCLHCLSVLRNGEGLLYKTTMSVNNLGKINVYEYIYFLAQHGKRHITQMSKNEAEYYENRK